MNKLNTVGKPLATGEGLYEIISDCFNLMRLQLGESSHERGVVCSIDQEKRQQRNTNLIPMNCESVVGNGASTCQPTINHAPLLRSLGHFAPLLVPHRCLVSLGSLPRNRVAIISIQL